MTIPNLAGTKNSQTIRAELARCRIDAVVVDRIGHEVSTEIGGILGDFRFVRAWRYWIATGPFPLELATKLYETEPATADFTQYAKAGFRKVDQERLAGFARMLKRRGVHVILSNADVPGVRELYDDGFTLHEVQARRSVNSDTTKRGKVGELIIT